MIGENMGARVYRWTRIRSCGCRDRQAMHVLCAYNYRQLITAPPSASPHRYSMVNRNCLTSITRMDLMGELFDCNLPTSLGVSRTTWPYQALT